MLGFKIRASFDAKGLRTAKRARKENKYPIYIRINKGIPQFVKLDLDNIEEKHWDGQTTSGKWVKATFKEHVLYNKYIDRAIFNIREFINESFNAGREITARDVKEWYEVKYLGKRSNLKVMVRTGDISVQDFFERAVKDLSDSLMPNTIKVYRTTMKQLDGYSPKAKMVDIDREFVRGFISFLRKDFGLVDNSIKKSIDKLKRVYEMYCSESSRLFDTLIFRDLGVKASGIAKEHIYLTEEEYRKVVSLQIPVENERLESVRNIFVFICNTGIYYNDLIACKKENLVYLEDNNNQVVLDGNRLKNGKPFWIPLNRAAKSALEKFIGPGSGYLVRKDYRIHDVTFNKFLKELATLAGINKNLTVKAGRKTCANWTKRIKLDQDHRNLMTGTLPKGVLDRNYTYTRDIHSYKEMMEKLDG